MPSACEQAVPSYRVAERFVSINGEGQRSGQLAAFIRLAGCNLDCSYCDTAWANEPECAVESLTATELIAWAQATGCHCITLTGGEPLAHPKAAELIRLFCETWNTPGATLEIETNGSIDITPYARLRNTEPGSRPDPLALAFTVDCKLPSSGMEEHMAFSSFASTLQPCDTVKFVAGTQQDLERMVDVIREFDLTERCAVFVSPVFGTIDPATIVDFLKQENLADVRLQLQLHKIIWPHESKGV